MLVSNLMRFLRYLFFSVDKFKYKLTLLCCFIYLFMLLIFRYGKLSDGVRGISNRVILNGGLTSVNENRVSKNEYRIEHILDTNHGSRKQLLSSKFSLSSQAWVNILINRKKVVVSAHFYCLPIQICTIE